jgi:hypothetical protein
MQHRHIATNEWIPMAVESLFDRGEMPDWQEFGRALAKDRNLGLIALMLAERHEDRGSAALARILVERFHPELLAMRDRSEMEVLRVPGR